MSNWFLSLNLLLKTNKSCLIGSETAAAVQNSKLKTFFIFCRSKSCFPFIFNVWLITFFSFIDSLSLLLSVVKISFRFFSLVTRPPKWRNLCSLHCWPEFLFRKFLINIRNIISKSFIWLRWVEILMISFSSSKECNGMQGTWKESRAKPVWLHYNIED